MGNVKMRVSVSHPTDDEHGGDYVAGEEYDLDDVVSDELIAKGYADGELSREISDEEIAEMKGNSQVVGT